MRKKLLVAPLLVVVAMVAVPTSGAAVFKIKRFPKVFINSVKASSEREPAIAVGAITLHNAQLGNLTCQNMVAGTTYNEFTEGTEKGFQNSTGYATFHCESQGECFVHNTKGERVPGIYATAESPPIAAGTEAHDTGVNSLPWTGELIERETGKKQVLTHNVEVWIVIPPPTVGEGTACIGTEIPFFDAKTETEREEGYELAPYAINGSKNGTHPSHGEFTGEIGLTEKGFPATGRLNSPVGPGYTKAEKLFTGGLKGGWELLTAE